MSRNIIMDATPEQRRMAEDAWLSGWAKGPERLRWSELPLQVGDAAPDLVLRSAEGPHCNLGDAWRDGPAILIFLRHFGCGCAWERAARLGQEYRGLVAAGATVVAIGQGDPARSRDFARLAGLPCPLLCDEQRLAYTAFGLLEAKPSQVVYGMPEAFLRRDPGVAAEFMEARRATPRPPVDSPWQLPGEFVIDPAGIIRLAYRSQYCADYADPDVLVAAITEARLGL